MIAQEAGPLDGGDAAPTPSEVVEKQTEAHSEPQTPKDASEVGTNQSSILASALRR